MRTVRFVALAAAVAAAGCVDRKFVVESNVPNAQVFIDNKPVGAAPAYAPFEYYGYYTITLVHPGYDTVTKRVKVAAPWYAYPPIDFLAEAVWPLPIRDTRRYYIELYESAQTRTDDILNAADALRQRGALLPAADRPAAPRTPPVPPGVVPSPLPAPAPVPAPAPAPPPGLVPSVQPGAGYTPNVGSYVK